MPPAAQTTPIQSLWEQLHMERELPRCEACGCEDDNLDRGFCRECEDYSEPSSAELYRDERTWGF